MESASIQISSSILNTFYFEYVKIFKYSKQKDKNRYGLFIVLLFFTVFPVFLCQICQILIYSHGHGRC